MHSILSDHWVVYSFFLLEISEYSSACLWWKNIYTSSTEYFTGSGVKRATGNVYIELLNCSAYCQVIFKTDL